MAVKSGIEQQRHRFRLRIKPQSAGAFKFFYFLYQSPVIIPVPADAAAASGNDGMALGYLISFNQFCYGGVFVFRRLNCEKGVVGRAVICGMERQVFIKFQGASRHAVTGAFPALVCDKVIGAQGNISQGFHKSPFGETVVGRIAEGVSSVGKRVVILLLGVESFLFQKRDAVPVSFQSVPAGLKGAVAEAQAAAAVFKAVRSPSGRDGSPEVYPFQGSISGKSPGADVVCVVWDVDGAHTGASLKKMLQGAGESSVKSGSWPEPVKVSLPSLPTYFQASVPIEPESSSVLEGSQSAMV